MGKPCGYCCGQRLYGWLTQGSSTFLCSAHQVNLVLFFVVMSVRIVIQCLVELKHEKIRWPYSRNSKAQHTFKWALHRLPQMIGRPACRPSIQWRLIFRDRNWNVAYSFDIRIDNKLLRASYDLPFHDNVKDFSCAPACVHNFICCAWIVHSPILRGL